MKYGVLIRKEKFDLIIDPYVKFQSQVLSLMSGAKIRVSFEKNTLPYAYTQKIPFLKMKSSVFGKAIDDRINLITTINGSIVVDVHPKLFLTPREIAQGKEKLSGLDPHRKTLMFGVLGSRASKSLPIEYIVEIIDFISVNYNVNILFNYMPSQRETMGQILEMLKNSDKIYSTIIGKDVREFIQIMNNCDLLIANEGGSVHIAKALKKATFTIFSPYIIKEFWATFENEQQNRSVHLKEVRPDLFKDKNRKQIAARSEQLYKAFTPSLIIPKLEKFMSENGF